MASRILGLVRDRLWAGSLGMSPALDAFLYAFMLPNLLRELLGDGALAAAFLPRYVQARDRDPTAAERFAGSVIARLALLLTGIAFLGQAAAAVVILYARGMPGLVALAVLPMVFYLVFICLVALLSAVMHGRRRFAAAAAMPVVLNLALIATVWLGPEREIAWLPYAVLIAGAVQLLLMLLALRLSGGVPPASFRPSPEEPELRRALVPTLIAAGAAQLQFLCGQTLILALVPGAGAVGAYYFANRLLQFPLALIGHGVTTAAAPELASAGPEGWRAVGDQAREGMRLMAFWLMPAAVGLAVMADPLARTLYQTGAFGEAAVSRTVLVTWFLALGLVPQSFNRLLVRACHARRDQQTPMRMTLTMVGATLVLGAALVLTPLGEAGLALAGALATSGSFMAYLILLHRRGAGALLPWSALVKPVLAALVMGTGVWALLRWYPAPTHGLGWNALRLATAVTAGVVVYLGTAWLLGVRRAPRR